jgi:hypothetical protein
MRELRLVGVEDGAVTLEALDGEKLRLPIDEQVRAAVRNAAINATNSLALTPREIQDRIRSGETISDIVAATGVNEDFVTKFAQPVMDELEHIIASALAIRITIAGDRFNDPTQVEFGELIQERLTANSAQDISWKSKRIAGGTWQLECNYSISGHRAQSVWHYEPRRFHLAPENEAAIALSNSETIDGPIAKLRSLNTVSETQSAPTAAPAAFRKQEDAVVNKQSAEAAEASDSTIGGTTNLLDEIRKRRESQAEPVAFEPESANDFIEEPEIFVEDLPEESFELDVVEDISDVADETILEEQDAPVAAEKDEEPAENQALEDSSPDEAATTTADAEPQPKKARASMPSWDEIVFGTKADE